VNTDGRHIKFSKGVVHHETKNSGFSLFCLTQSHIGISHSVWMCKYNVIRKKKIFMPV